MNTQNQPALEVVHFTSNPEVSDEQLITAATAMREILQSWPGFIKRELIKVKDKHWIDVVHWSNSETAMAAQQSAMQSKVCVAYFALMTASEEQMFHGNIVLSQQF